MEKLKELVEKELESMQENGLDSNNIDAIYKLVDIHKDIANEEYWKAKKEAMEMRYNGDYEGYGEGGYGEGYGRRRRDSRGRFMAGRGGQGGRGGGRGGRGGYSEGGGSYGHYMPYPEMYMERMMDGMEGYMEGREQYERGNYGGKDQSIESLEKMLEGIVAFVEEIQHDPEQKEEKEVVNHYIKKLKEM